MVQEVRPSSLRSPDKINVMGLLNFEQTINHFFDTTMMLSEVSVQRVLPLNVKLFVRFFFF